MFSHVAGSSMMFINTANAALIAILLGLLTSLFGPNTPAAAIVGVACGVSYFTAYSMYGNRLYRAAWQSFTPMSPTPSGGS